ncbi:MAG: hypothetical protein JNL38_09355 [Myxococcales bacterium]|nr:hypothetical protein [Myxococcales bacterium]
MSDVHLAAARALLDAGAGASACRVLGALRGREANDLREASASASLSPGVYAMVEHEGAGLVLPVRARVGPSPWAPPDVREASAAAMAAVRAWLREPSLPELGVELPPAFGVRGISMGLPAALAFVAHLCPGAAPEVAVLATGRIDASGAVLPVAHVREKLAGAAEEAGRRVVVVPLGADAPGAIAVADLGAAVDACLGPGRALDPAAISLDGAIARARLEADPRAAAAILEAIPRVRLAAADRARVLLELGTRLRHAGETARATELHEAARAELAASRQVVGLEAAERYELEVILTGLDRYELEGAAAALSARLAEPFFALRSELRCRGALAQALSMLGRPREALALREENQPLHERSDELARVLPGTLCQLALDAARAGEAAALERYAAALLRATPPGDARQWAFSASAVVRALVLAGRDAEAVAWARGERMLHGVLASAALVRLATSGAPIAGHPETSTARALVRAHGRLGDAEAASRLAARVVQSEGARGDHAAWLARLAALEAALWAPPAERARAIDAARAALRPAHEPASAHHADLFTAAPGDLAAAIDRVFY